MSLGPVSGQISFQKVVDNADSLPGTAGEVHGFSQPAISNGTVAFMCYEKKPVETFARLSIFARKNGVFHRVATTQESQIGGQTLFLSPSAVYSAPMIRDDGSVAFEGSAGSKSLIAEWKDGTLRKLFDQDDATALVGAGTNWYSDLPMLTEDGRVVRKVNHPTDRDVLVQEQGGEFSILQRVKVPLPPDQTVGGGLGAWAAFHGGLVFREWQATNRVYRKQGEAIGVIGRPWNNGVPGDFPGLGGDVFTINGLKATARLTAMLGSRRTANGANIIYGLYGWAGGSWFKIAEVGMPAPGGGTYTGVPEHANTISLDDGALVFHASTTQGQGLFLYHAGTVTPLLMAGQMLDGRALGGSTSSSQSLGGKKLAIYAYAADGTKQGIYTADLSALMPGNVGTLPVTTARWPGNQVAVTVPGQDGYIYYLHRSTDLGSWTIVDQKMGTAGPVVFTEDAGAAAEGQAFFRVEEVKR